MSEIRELYQQLILDHGRKPRNFGVLATATHIKQGFNPLCGDRLQLYLQIENNIIKKAQFDGDGCAISLASASMMTEALLGMTEEQADQLFELFHHGVTSGECDEVALGKLHVLTGVAQYPARVKCATLAWQTLKAILTDEAGEVCTES